MTEMSINQIKISQNKFEGTYHININNLETPNLKELVYDNFVIPQLLNQEDLGHKNPNQSIESYWTKVTLCLCLTHMTLLKCFISYIFVSVLKSQSFEFHIIQIEYFRIAWLL